MESWLLVKKLLISEVEDLNKRKKVWNRLSLYIDNIFQKLFEQLLIHPEFNKKLAIESLPRIYRKQKEIFNALFTSPDLNNQLDALGTRLARWHFRRGFDPKLLGYGFSVLISLIYEITQKDELIKENFLIIIKIFKLIELIFYKEYYENPIKKIFYESILQSVNEAFKLVKLHKRSFKIIQDAFHFKDKENIIKFLKQRNIPLTLDECPLLRWIERMEKGEEFPVIPKEDLERAKNFKLEWFSYLHELIERLERGETEGLDVIYEKLIKSSRNILDIISKPIQDMAGGIVLLINSGMKFLYKVTEMIYEGEGGKESKEIIFENMVKEIEKALEDTLSWVIEDVSFSSRKEENDYDIIQEFSVLDSGKKIYIGIKLYSQLYLPYIKDLVRLVLEISKLLVLLKEREVELVEMADRAEAANRAKDMFLANMSHELRTPLNAIMGFAQILKMRNDVPDSIKSYIEKIYIAGKNLLELVNTILDFTKLEAGKVELEFQKVSIGDILTEVDATLQPLIQQKNLEFSYPQSPSINLYVDPKLMKEVFFNLVSNAIKFTPEQGKIWIDIEFSKEKKSYVFSVCDTGIGIKKEDISKLFKPFTQLNNPFQKATKGTGLGLAITKKIIELHKGEIWVESEYGKGTCFYFTLPVREEAATCKGFKS